MGHKVKGEKETKYILLPSDHMVEEGENRPDASSLTDVSAFSFFPFLSSALNNQTNIKKGSVNFWFSLIFSESDVMRHHHDTFMILLYFSILLPNVSYAFHYHSE